MTRWTYSRKRVQRNRLESDEVVAAGDRLGDGGRPRRVLRDHDTVTPDSVIDRPVDQAHGVDFELYNSRSGPMQSRQEGAVAYPFNCVGVYTSAAA